ncbi:CPBP family intramembrane metalloprotease [Candidatus Woesearchaeota archaeon]|nr:CPBP family intramembrane metalloprotease [Candidatus Woesearchaeota archaeon]
MISQPRTAEYINLFLLGLSALLLVGFQNKPIGWTLLGLALVTLYWCRQDYRKNLLLIHATTAVLGLMRITTNLSYTNILQMGSLLFFALILPYFVQRKHFKVNHIQFRFRMGRKWRRREATYIILMIVLGYLIIPFYFSNTGAWANWMVPADAHSLIKLFLACIFLGIWDELYFVSSVFGTLDKYFNFWTANAVMSILFTSFLYELGFTDWGFFMIYLFALFQGYAFKKTHSLNFVIALHLILDFILFLALVNAHHPQWLNIFII